MSESTGRTLCAIFAHPDDESFSSGGTIARYADEGVHVTLVTATRGEAGDNVGPPIELERLAEVRERELRAAAEILGVGDLRLLHLPDGKLTERDEDLRAGIRQVLAEIRPQVVITEDIQGITGHPDHIAVARATVRVCEELGDAGPLKLYEHVVPLERVAEIDWLKGTPEDYITTRLDVERWRSRLLAALEAHRTQVNAQTLERMRGFPPPWQDSYVCVRTRVPILIPEEDLFAGID